MKWPGVFLLPSTHLYTWVERGKCLTLEQHYVPAQGSNPESLLWSWVH